MPPTCSVLGCGANKNNKGPKCSMHLLPKNENQKRTWLDAIGIENLKNNKKIFICNRHFQQSEINYTLGYPRLKDDAVPTLFVQPTTSKESEASLGSQQCSVLLQPPQEKSTSNSEVYLGSQQSSASGSGSKRLQHLLNTVTKLKDKIKHLNATVRRQKIKLASFQNTIEELKEKNLVNHDNCIVLEQCFGPKDVLLRQISKTKGLSLNRQYPEGVRKFALKLHFLSPKAYNFVRNSYGSCLPHPRTLCKWYQNINAEPGFCKEAFDTLKAKKKQDEIKKSSPLLEKNQWQQIQVKKIISGGQQVIKKTIITPSGQKIIQRTIQRPTPQSDGKSPVSILNKKLSQSGDNSLLRRSGLTARGRGGRTYSTPNVVRVREKSISFDFGQSDASSDTSDGITDPFPSSPGPLPPPSPARELTLCPLTGRRLARAEGEPTPPPTPPPQPEPEPAPLLMKVEMSPGGTTGMLIQGDGAQPSLPVLTDDDSTEVKVEASAVKQLLEDGVGVDESGVSLLHSGHTPIMIRGEDGVLYQVAGENEAGQTLLVAAEGVEGVEAGGDGAEDGDGVMYVTREDGQEMVSLDSAGLAGLVGAGGLQQVAVQVEGEHGEDATQVIAQIVQTDLPSPGGTRRVVLLLPDGSLTMTELDKEQYESITEASKAQE